VDGSAGVAGGREFVTRDDPEKRVLQRALYEMKKRRDEARTSAGGR
jgi:hypothetical protein